MAFASLLKEFIEEHLDLRGRGPTLHGDAVDDGILLDRLFVFCKGGLFQINRESDMALWAVDMLAVVLERLDIVLGTLATEFMPALRPDGIFCGVITDAAHSDVEPRLRLFLQNEIGMVRNLAHLHDQSEDVGIVVQHDTVAHVGIEFSGRVRHDTTGEILFDLAEKFIVQRDTFRWKLHRLGMLVLHAAEHDMIRDEPELVESVFALFLGFPLDDGVEDFLVED